MEKISLYTSRAACWGDMANLQKSFKKFAKPYLRFGKSHPLKELLEALTYIIDSEVIDVSNIFRSLGDYLPEED